MAQIKDVAQRAGVSVATVSRALAGHSGVSETARQPVLAAVQALDYRPDLGGRGGRLYKGRLSSAGKKQS